MHLHRPRDPQAQSLRSLRTFTLAAAAVLALPGPASAQGEILKLPQSVWTDINRFVFLVALDIYSPGSAQPAYQEHLKKLETSQELYWACVGWGRDGFPALQRFAEDLAKDDIRNMLEAMHTASDGIAAGGGDPGHVFETQSQALEARFKTLSEIAQNLTFYVDRLQKASKATIYESKRRQIPLTGFVEVGADPDRAQSAIEAAANRWKWLLSDVQELRRLVGQARSADSEKEKALYASIGLDTWKDIATNARGFLTDVPRQQRFLSGDNYYDDCGVVEGKWLKLHNLSVGFGRGWLSLGFPPGKNFGYDFDAQLRLAGVNHEVAMSWRFRKVGKGWWMVTNEAGGDSRLLNGFEGQGPEPTVRLAVAHSFSGVHYRDGQYWRFLPLGNLGGCRVINSYLGYLSSLTARRWPGRDGPSYDVIMARTTNELNQQWRILQ
jgi:hypothetical protein